mmetsp:Transcript_1435/g.2280  ORF Transcript_1435/g.2280 Transcript_1435/m.2280 type:complete len:449 (-) Transcript_1435:49-1395(-)
MEGGGAETNAPGAIENEEDPNFSAGGEMLNSMKDLLDDKSVNVPPMEHFMLKEKYLKLREKYVKLQEQLGTVGELRAELKVKDLRIQELEGRVTELENLLRRRDRELQEMESTTKAMRALQEKCQALQSLEAKQRKELEKANSGLGAEKSIRESAEKDKNGLQAQLSVAEKEKNDLQIRLEKAEGTLQSVRRQVEADVKAAVADEKSKREAERRGWAQDREKMERRTVQAETELRKLKFQMSHNEGNQRANESKGGHSSADSDYKNAATILIAEAKKAGRSIPKWIKFWDEETGDEYFYNWETKESVWQIDAEEEFCRSDEFADLEEEESADRFSRSLSQLLSSIKDVSKVPSASSKLKAKDGEGKEGQAQQGPVSFFESPRNYVLVSIQFGWLRLQQANLDSLIPARNTALGFLTGVFAATLPLALRIMRERRVTGILPAIHVFMSV